jgi:hypothetical protein
VVAEIDGGEPEANAGCGVQAEAPFLVPAVEEEHVAGDGAVEAGEDVDAVAAVADHGGVPCGEVPAGERDVEFVGHGEIRASGGNEGVAEEAESVDGEEAEVEAFEERERAEEIPEHAENEIGNVEHVAEAEKLGEEGVDVRLEAEAEISADEEGVDVEESGIEERAAMDFGDDGGQVHVGDVHDDGVVEEAETPGPLVGDTGREVDEESGDEEERGVNERERAGEAGGADETEPGDEDEELEEEFVGEKAGGVTSRGKRDSSLRGLRSE